jgi:hypothetical protein
MFATVSLYFRWLEQETKPLELELAITVKNPNHILFYFCLPTIFDKKVNQKIFILQ